jgi:hypothetical protein
MEVWIVEAALAAVVLFGTIVMVWGVRRFNLSSNTLAVTFAITALSWLALIIIAIGLTVRTIALASV